MDNEEEVAEEAVDPLAGARLLARGIPINLLDGAHVLKYDYEALEMIEEDFGGIDKFMVELAESRYGKNRLKNIRLAITAGLVHEREATLPEFYDQVRKNLDARRLVDYLDAMTRAIIEAFPPPTEADKAPKATGSGASPGNGSSGSPRSSTGAQKRSSGAQPRPN